MQVIIVYEDNVLVQLDIVVIFIQYVVDIDLEKMFDFDIWEKVFNIVFDDLVYEILDVLMVWVLVNLIGKFVFGGLMGDVGFIGCKIIVDIYGGWVCYGGGVFFGKDLFKVDWLVVYVMCWVVKNVVVVGLVEWVEVQVVYVIGKVVFVGLFVEMFGIEMEDLVKIEKVIGEVFDLCFGVIICDLNLLCLIYVLIVVYGYFGCIDVELLWEQFDKVDDFKCVIQC